MKIAIMLACLVCAASGRAQDSIVSPEVSKDNTVTFRLKMPNAQKVLVELEAVDTHFEMTKDSAGLWTVTTGPLKPQIYGYFFLVDGQVVLDAENPERMAGWKSNLVLVPGNPPEPWEVQDVPHGEIHHVFYKSKVIGDQSEYFVYTPPGYARGSKYPVLFLLHGNGWAGSVESWIAVGKANTIFDNLVASGRMRSMVVVMPSGYGLPSSLTVKGLNNRDAALKERSYDNFKKSLLSEVIPQVESEYKVSKNPKLQAIAGLSMGARETLDVALNNPDRFAYVGAFSSGSKTDDFDADFPGLAPKTFNQHVRLFMVSCGSGDHLAETNQKLKAWLRGKGVNFEDVVTPGQHEWPVWRNNLIHFCQEIFKGN